MEYTAIAAYTSMYAGVRLAIGLALLAPARPVVGQPVESFEPLISPDYNPSGWVPWAHIVTGHLAQQGVVSALCPGKNDILAVTFAGAIVDNVADIDSKNFVVLTTDVPMPGGREAYETIEVFSVHATDVKCAVVQPGGDEPNERRTILLFGKFTGVRDGSIGEDGREMLFGPTEISFESIGILVNGERTNVACDIYDHEDSCSLSLSPAEPWQFSHADHGPFLADIGMHNLSAPLNTAAADPNGCAAVHPSATYAIRLLFASAVHERAPNGTLVPFGTSAATAAAAFSLLTARNGTAASPDTVLGVADVDGDNVVDLCVAGAAAEPQVDAVFINCTAGDVMSPAGDACDKPILAFMKSRQDTAKRRERGEGMGGRKVEICLSMEGHCSAAVVMAGRGGTTACVIAGLAGLAATWLADAASLL